MLSSYHLFITNNNLDMVLDIYILYENVLSYLLRHVYYGIMPLA